ncbi:MAG: hypothetical protein PGN34_25315 [Methylobacterium frigidaeris]
MEKSVLDGPCRYPKQTAAHGAPGAHPWRTPYARLCGEAPRLCWETMMEPTIDIVLSSTSKARQALRNVKLVDEQGSCKASHTLDFLTNSDVASSMNAPTADGVYDVEVFLDQHRIYDDIAILSRTHETLRLEGSFYYNLNARTARLAGRFMASWSSGMPCEMPAFRSRKTIVSYIEACRIFRHIFALPQECTNLHASVDMGGIRYFDEAFLQIGHQIVGPGFHLATTVSELRNVLADELDVSGLCIRIDNLYGNLSRLARNERRVYGLYRAMMNASGAEMEYWDFCWDTECLDFLKVLRKHGADLSIT